MFKTAVLTSSYRTTKALGFCLINRTLSRTSAVNRLPSPALCELYHKAASRMSCFARGRMIDVYIKVLFQCHSMQNQNPWQNRDFFCNRQVSAEPLVYATLEYQLLPVQYPCI